MSDHRSLATDSTAAERTSTETLPPSTPIPEMLHHTTDSAPDSVAVCDAHETLTYTQLTRRIDHLANRLVESGVGVGDRVGVLLRPGCQLIVAAVAVMKIGAAYVPIDPTSPAVRTGHLLSTARVAAAITEPQDTRMVAAHGFSTLEADRGCTAQYLETPSLQPDHLACIMFTSGSSGPPKGVMITHRGLSNLACAADAELALRSSDRFLMLASASFAASLEEMFPPLVSGGACVYPPDRASLSSPRALLEFAAAQQVTVLELQPPQWHVLVDFVVGSERALPTTLRRVIVGGDRVLPTAAESWSGFGPPLVHVYGQTECTATATYCTFAPSRMPARESIPGQALPIGRPISGMRLDLVDDWLHPVETGAVGEVVLGGDSLARGYFDQPGFTATRFVADPFSGRPGAVVYRTGDLAREAADGGIGFVDRADRQVKIRGYRIEPTEIEVALQQHPSVRDVLVLPHGMPARAYLVAYVTTDRRTLTGNDLQRFASEQLPPHLVPAIVVCMDEFPVTTHGKVDRVALEQRLADQTSHDPDHDHDQSTVSPDDIARELGAYAANLLGVASVGIDDNLLELGGDSMVIVAMISRIDTRFSVDIGFRTAFDEPTISALTSHVRASTARRGV